MNTALLPFDLPSEETSLPHWQPQIEAWRRMLSRCAQKPSRGRVHALRVATLRLQMQLEYWREHHEPGVPAVLVAKRWNRLADKLRRALGPVRAADVFLAKLERLRSAAADDGIEPGCDRNHLRPIKELERGFARRRQSSAKKLVAGIEQRFARMARASRELEAVLAPDAIGSGSFRAEAVAGLFAGLVAEFPELNSDTLHAFRMRIKKVRYLNELFAATDSVANRQAAALSRMQVVLGEWHDWTVLAGKARRMLKKPGRQGGLVELLDVLADKSLHRALSVCRRLTARVLRHSAEPEAFAETPKKSVHRAEPVSIGSAALRA